MFLSDVIFTWEGEHMDLTDISNHFLSGPLAGLNGLLSAAAYIIGIMLLVSAYQKRKHHHHNPHEGTLVSCLVYVILALVMFILPFAYSATGQHYF
ncbi:MAG: hypothetical protein A3C55_05160 [Gammaproteobacteria bacterium RIFCSPHIGHO2_02_FULL_42_13]|nr:MAG: hypothetical protein A3C55_05160 [Gammaproteobacteria bacterium RIFCSPHIGHO2_02_FULL_42_13]OGT69174.1 MAG: hypothetical protein A3H43_00455 [Gammaproteobacteria bacterium RIFCSPLOWO2_02_FULL_42_9]